MAEIKGMRKILMLTLRELIIAELIFAVRVSEKDEFCGIYFCRFDVRGKFAQLIFADGKVIRFLQMLY